MARWRQLPVAAMCLGLGALLAVGGVYLLNFRQREAYIVSRNLRLLEVVAKQAELVIDGFTRRAAADAKVDPAALVLRIDETLGGRVLTARPSEAAASKTPRPAQKNLGDLLGPVFAPKLAQGAFDTLALVQPDGRIAFAVGRRDWEVGGEALAALLPADRGTAPSGKNEAPTDATRLAVVEATLAGVPYTIFVQRCCHLDPGAPSARSARVIGLVVTDALEREAMAISPVMVVVATLLVALALLAWPFLNVALRGPRRRATWGDLLPLGSTGALGLAIATMLVLTTGKCASLERDVDHQLQTLADEIADDLRADLADGSSTLDAMEQWLASCDADASFEAAAPGTCHRADDAKPVAAYTAVSLIDAAGQQRRKVWAEPDASTLVSVGDRDYFRAARAARTESGVHRRRLTPWCGSGPCFFQSLVSITTGVPSAVLARPTRVDGPHAVAAIGLKMRSVIEPLVPPGFEFAVIDPAGQVHFHSDTQRNTFENLFTETDENRQLRSLVASGLNGTVRTDYWGRPYLVHVHHAGIFGWSVVTMFERQHLRHLTFEWTVASLVLLAVYWALWNLALLAVTATGMSWLWPDRFRHDRYFALGFVYLACLGGFALAAGTAWFTRAMVGVAGFVVPIVACAITAAVLYRRPAAVADAASLDVETEYCIPAALLLVVVGVLPGAAFIARSYDAHIEAYVKHRQIEVTRALAATGDGPGWPAACGLETGDEERPRGQHVDFLYGTSVCSHAGPLPGGSALPGHGGDPDRWWLLEAMVPYVSEASVQLRELVHQHADDGSWASERVGPRLTLRLPDGSADHGGHLVATTTIPAVGTRELTAFLLAAGAVLLAMAYGIARFVTRYVFLGSVTAPQWAVGRLAIPHGGTVVIACDPPALLARLTGARHLDLAAVDQRGTDDVLAALRHELQSPPDGRPLVAMLGSKDGDGATMAGWPRMLSPLVRERGHALLLLCPFSPVDLTATGERPVNDVIELDWRTRAGAAVGPLAVSVDSRPAGWWPRTGTHRANDLLAATPTLETKASPAERLLRREEQAHVGLQAIAGSIRQLDAFRAGRLSRAETLDELDEAAQPFYTELWHGCSDQEKLELLQVAEFGSAHVGNAKAVRQLIARRLVTKDPDLRLMNSTFRRFVLRCRADGDPAQADVQRIEGALAESAWDRYRAPLALAVVGVAVFLFVTQRDTYNATVGAAVSLATQLPNILKALTVVVNRDPAALPRSV